MPPVASVRLFVHISSCLHFFYLSTFGSHTRASPDALDEAVRRPGRLDIEIEMGVPNVDERGAMLLKILSRNRYANLLTLEQAVEVSIPQAWPSYTATSVTI